MKKFLFTSVMMFGMVTAAFPAWAGGMMRGEQGQAGHGMMMGEGHEMPMMQHMMGHGMMMQDMLQMMKKMIEVQQKIVGVLNLPRKRS